MKNRLLFLFIFIIINSQFTVAQAPTVQISKEDSEKGQEEYAANVAAQAYLYGVPMVLNYRFQNVVKGLVKRTTDPNFKMKMMYPKDGLTYNQWVHVNNLPTHDLNTMASPNDDTNYSIFFADLEKEPIVLSIPPINDRYFSITLSDAFLDVVGYIGSRYGDTKGGNYILVGPDWKGELPKKNFKKVFRMRHNVFGFVARMQVKDPSKDMELAATYQNKFTSQSLSKFLNKTEKDTFLPLETYKNTDNALEWYSFLFNKMAINRPLPSERHLVKSLANIGVKIGNKIDANALSEPVKRGLERGFKSGKQQLDWYVNKGLELSPNNWFLDFDRGTDNNDYITRARHALVGLYTNLTTEANYPQIIYDNNGEKLSGKYSYQMIIPKEKVSPVTSFWSITIYQASDFVPNKYFHYSVGDAKKYPVKRNADGSVTITFSHAPPNENELGNWLPTPTADLDFRVVYRMYGPKPEILNSETMNTYLPAIKRIN
ncbi:MAG: DUF1254 domain-containing protein [Saprospiraceae bacterium]|jgi:hypothetical protein|nr:DUF1254 domain-containing protein [Saprospiraceae bacterium]